MNGAETSTDQARARPHEEAGIGASDLRALMAELENPPADLAWLVKAMAQLIHAATIGGRAGVGSVVRVADRSGRLSEYELIEELVPARERQKVAATSAIGRELLGARQGDWVWITVADGRRMRVQVIDVVSQPA
jgi:transcription elongation GreA/GreB family factor